MTLFDLIGTMNTEQPVKILKLSESCIAFRLRNLFVTNNKFVMMSPQIPSCLMCFLRRFLSQADGEPISQIDNSALNLAKNLDNKFKVNKTWRSFSIENPGSGATFELIPYEDCPKCAKATTYSSADAAAHYQRLLSQQRVAKLDALRNRVFSFGFARSLVSDNQIGPDFPAIRKILGDSHHARLIFKMVTPEGASSNETSTGFASNRNLAELKAIMEYLERYAFLLKVCRLKTHEFDARVISDYLSLHSESVTDAEDKIIKSSACWGLNLSTHEIRAIPLSFLYSDGRLRFIRPSASGFGAHTDFKLSLCSSILELVERDAFVRFWYDPRRSYVFEPEAKITMAIDGIQSALKTVLNNDRLGSKCFVIESPTKLPVVMLTISSLDSSKPPSLCFGLGVGFNLQGAMTGALKELRINASNLVKAVSLFDGFLTRRFANKIVSIQDRMNLYATSTPRAKLRFLDTERPLVEGVVESTEQDSLDALIERLNKINFDIYGLDCTPSCFQQMNVFVTRAFSPQLFPLQFEADTRFNLPTGPLSVHQELPHFFI